MPGHSYGVAVAGNYAYIAASEGGLQVVNVTDRADPAVAAQLDTAGDAYSLAVSGNYAYVADIDTIQILDISNPLNPVPGGTYDVAADALAISGSYAYVAEWDTLTILNIADPLNPVDRRLLYDTSGRVSCGGLGQLCLSRGRR